MLNGACSSSHAIYASLIGEGSLLRISFLNFFFPPIIFEDHIILYNSLIFIYLF